MNLMSLEPTISLSTLLLQEEETSFEHRAYWQHFWTFFYTNIKQNLYTIYSQQILKNIDAKVATCALTPKNKVNTKNTKINHVT